MSGILRIGGASGFWGESAVATPQLLQVAGLDYLVYDYLAEITMSIMARARMKDPSKGYATDFVTEAMGRNLKAIAANGVKVISNAGGVNPVACAEALRGVIAEQGVSLKVAVVEGDDILPRVAEFADRTEMFSGAPMPPVDKIASMNAYIGAGPIVAALQAGADIVITGRCVDSAVTLAAAMHHFGWSPEDYELLAAGALAGHLLECGPQATGGNFTDWRMAGDIARIGYPVAEITSWGDVTITKPDGTAGIVTPASVTEQMLYEIGDPDSYILPDVVCDFSSVKMTQTGENRVLVEGARGRAPTGQLKVSATWMDGFRAGFLFQFNGMDAREKAEVYAQAALDKARDVLTQMGAPDFRETCVETFGGRPGDGPYEEITLKAAVRHDDARAVGLFLKEFIGNALATPPGLHGFTGAGRPKPSPVVALFSFLLEASALDLRVSLDGQDIGYVAPDLPLRPLRRVLTADPLEVDLTQPDLIEKPLEDLAWARSGDKGDKANIGVIARHRAYAPWIWANLTPAFVAETFGDLLQGPVERFCLPETQAMNLLLHNALGGGGVASLRNDSQAKSYAQKLLARRIKIPASLIVNEPEGND